MSDSMMEVRPRNEDNEEDTYAPTVTVASLPETKIENSTKSSDTKSPQNFEKNLITPDKTETPQSVNQNDITDIQQDDNSYRNIF